MNIPSYLSLGFGVPAVTVGALEYDLSMFFFGTLMLFYGAVMLGFLE